METMQYLSQSAEKVEGSDNHDEATATKPPTILDSAMTLWADRLLDEPFNSLPMLQWNPDKKSLEIEGRQWRI